MTPTGICLEPPVCRNFLYNYLWNGCRLHFRWNIQGALRHQGQSFPHRCANFPDHRFRPDHGGIESFPRVDLLADGSKRTVTDHHFHASLPHLLVQGHGEIQKLYLHEMALIRDRGHCHFTERHAIN